MVEHRSAVIVAGDILGVCPALRRKSTPLQFTSDSRGIAAEFQACVVIKGQGLHRNRAPAGLVSNVETRDFHWRNCGLASSEGERRRQRSEEHTSELQSLMRISYAVFCLKKKNQRLRKNHNKVERR